MACLIDGDPIVYAAAFSAQKTIYFFENRKTGETIGLPSKVSLKRAGEFAKIIGISMQTHALKKRKEIKSEGIACFAAKAIMTSIVEATEDKCEAHKVFLTDTKRDKNYRDSIATLQPYKGNRTQDKPFHYDLIRSYLMEKYGAEMISGQEADDELGIQATENIGNSIICSIDKDLLTVPGQHYNYSSKEWKSISEVEASRNFYTQMVEGDTTDNVPSLAKTLAILGNKEAGLDLIRHKYIKIAKEKLTNMLTEEEMFKYVFDLYTGYGVEEKYILEIGRLLRIRRKREEMWQFPKEL